MSWPADGLPRYTLAVIKGGIIGATAGNPWPEYYVYDRGYCHRIVWQSGGDSRQHRSRTVAQEAAWQCERFNLIQELVS